MKEDAQLICPVGYDDKDDVWQVIQKFICDRLPLKDVTWRSPISSSFVNIEKLPLRFLPANAKLFNETQHPYRRFLAPYVHLYLLCAESMDAYKASKPVVKKWVEQYNNAKIGKQPWLLIYVPKGTSTMDVYNKVYARISSDFYTEKAGDHSVMLILPPESSKRPNISAQDRVSQQSLFQQAFAALADLLGKLRDGVVASFQLRTAQYDADIRRLDSLRATANFDFWQLFLVKESLALMFQMMQMPDRALSLYDELEVLLAFAPDHSLPVNDWPMVAPSSESRSSSGGSSTSPAKPRDGGSASGGRTERGESTSRERRREDSNSSSNDATEGHHRTASEEVASFQSPTKGGSSGASSSRTKKDLMSDSCRCGEDIIVYSINQARMNILWNRFSFFQLQHYIFARQMYFLLVHLRQPTRCAEKALMYMRSATIQLEQRMLRQYAGNGVPSTSGSNAASPVNTPGATGSDPIPIPGGGAPVPDKASDEKLLQLRHAQADVWALVAALKLIRECRALLQLLVGGDSAYNSIFASGPGERGNNAAASGMSYSQNVASSSSAQESFQDNLAAISSASTHGGSVVYSSLAELSRSQHGFSHAAGVRKASVSGGGVGSVGSGGSGGDMSSPLSSVGSVLSPAAALREVLFSPQLDIAVEVRDSSRVLGELVEFALARLQALSSNTVRQAGRKAIEIALSTEPFTLERLRAQQAALLQQQGVATVRRTVTKVSTAAPTASASADGITGLLGLSVSPRNSELVGTIEQELSLLDETRNAEGLAGVGERMDQILLSISQKVRSTSHFWSKLYEVSTPTHLLYPGSAPTGSNTGGTVGSGGTANQGGPGERARGDSFESSPTGSPFSSRAGTPIGSPVPGSVLAGSAEGAQSHSLRKMITRHSSRSLVVSKSQLERGRLLELCLSVLGCSAQWHLQLLANRPRFAISAMLRCADLLLCNDQIAVAAKRLEEALQSGLLAPVAAYILAQPGAGAVVTTSSGGHAGLIPAFPGTSSRHPTTRLSIFQKCMAGKQLHQQQEGQYRTLNFAAALAPEHYEVYPLHGAWAQLWHWTLRKLLYCMQRTGKWEEYRAVLANLLVPLSPDGVSRLSLQPESLLADILNEFVALSSLPARASAPPSAPAAPKTIAAPVGDSVEESTSPAGDMLEIDGIALIEDTLEPARPPPGTLPTSLPLLRLPLSSYFDVAMGMVRPRQVDETRWSPRLVKGYEVVREEWLPVSAMQCEGGREGGYCLPIVLHSKLPGPVSADALCAVYKRFSAETIVTQTMHARDTSSMADSTDGDSATTLAGILAIADDEFVCQPMRPAGAEGPALVLEPGTRSLCMAFQPPALGDYRLDRIVLVVGTAVFEAHMLPEVCIASAPRAYAASTEPSNLPGRDDMFASPGLAGLSLLDDLDATTRGEEDRGARVFTAGESAALDALKTYFRQHHIIQVLPPDDLLGVTATVARSVPVAQCDDAYFTADAWAGDELHDLKISAWGESTSGLTSSISLTRSGDGSLSNSGNLGGSLNRLNTAQSATATALKLAQGLSPAGFVPAEQATPAAMRRRRADPMDDEEAQAMASAAAAVASLLAQQANASRHNSNRRGGDAGDGSGGVDLELVVACAEEWAVAATVDDAAAAPVPLSAFEAEDSAVGKQQASLGDVKGKVKLHIRVPFSVHRPALGASQGHAADGQAGEVVLKVELSATLTRAGCTIPVCVTKEVVVRALPLVSMTLEAYHTCAVGSAEAGRVVLLQAALFNGTNDALELTSYRVHNAGDSAVAPVSSTVTLLDGPTDLAVLSEVDKDVPHTTEVVSLLPAERYDAGLAVQCASHDAKEDAGTNGAHLEFHFQRTPGSLRGGVHECIYRHRSFVVSRALTLMPPDASGVDAADAGRVTSLHDDRTDGSRCVSITAEVVMPTGGAMPPLRHGCVVHCVYRVIVHFPLSEHGSSATTAETFVYHYSDDEHPGQVTTPTRTNAVPAGIAAASKQHLRELTVTLGETADWMAVGHTRRILTAYPLRREEQAVGTNESTDSSEGARAGATGRWVEAHYTLHWAMVPVALGKVSLPPLQVEYVLAGADAAAQGRPACERLHPHSEVVYLNKLQGGDVVHVVPAVCSSRPYRAAIAGVESAAGGSLRGVERMVVVRTQLVAQSAQ